MIQTERYSRIYTFLLPLSLALVVAFASYWMSVRVASGVNTAYLPPFVLLTVLIMRNPILGLYVYFFILMLVPYWVRVPGFPLFNSPLEIITLTTLGIAGARFVLLGKRIPKNKVLFLLALIILILSMHTLFKHGPSSAFWLYRFVQGSLPFVLILLLVETPKQARNVLVAGIASVMSMVLLWLPFMAAYSSSPWFDTGSGILLRDCHGAYMQVRCANSPASWLGIGGPTFPMVVSMVTPLLLSLMLSWPLAKLRVLATLSLLACLLYLALATFWMSIAGILIGTLIVLLISRSSRAWRRTLLIPILLLPVLAITPLLKVFTSGISLASSEIVTSSGRWSDINIGIKLFMSAPLTGIGGYFATLRTSSGQYLPAHSSLVDFSYMFGLPMLISLLLLLGTVAYQIYWLQKHSASKEVRTLCIGFLGGIGSFIFLSIFNPAFGSIFPDNIFWLYAGLASLWAMWLRKTYKSQPAIQSQ